MAKERGTSHEKRRERGKADIGHCILAVAERPFAPVRKTGANGFEFGEQGLQRGHADSESTNALRRQANRQGPWGGAENSMPRCILDSLWVTGDRIGPGAAILEIVVRTHLELLANREWSAGNP